MFCGIVQATAKVKAVKEKGGIRAVAIAAPRGWKLRPGASVSVNGICSTIAQNGGGVFVVEYMPETLRITTAKDLKSGSIVNLERSLRYGEHVDGHFVQGHVDGVGRIMRIVTAQSSHEVVFNVPRELRSYVAQKGSITLNGVALTVTRVEGGACTVALVPFTLAHTNLGSLSKGDRVNVEVDLIARYLAQLRKK